MIFCILIYSQATRNGTAENIDGVEPDVVNYGYFRASLAVWFALPVPVALIDLISDVGATFITPCCYIMAFPFPALISASVLRVCTSAVPA